MNKSIIGSLIVVVAIVASIFAVSNNSTDNNNASIDESSTSSPSSETTASGTEFSVSEVQTHDNENDCWTYIGNKVYDITQYIPRHPGGDDILLACGADGTTLFEQRRTQDGEKVGSGLEHSSNATSQLERYLKGNLSQ